MKETLLSLVQSILAKLDADEVETINETMESVQVASFIKDAYYEIISEKNWSHTKSGLIVSQVGIDKPNYIMLPDNIKEIVSIEYDCREANTDNRLYRKMKYKIPDEFFSISNSRRNLTENVSQIVDFSGSTFFILTNTAPTYYTSIDDKYLIFDAYHSAIDSTLKASKFLGEAYYSPSFTIADDFVPDLPEEMFTLLKAKATREAFMSLKQTDNPLAGMAIKKAEAAMSARSWTVTPNNMFPNYGRSSKK